jgi:hypothetical protein
VAPISQEMVGARHTTDKMNKQTGHGNQVEAVNPDKGPRQKVRVNAESGPKKEDGPI